MLYWDLFLPTDKKTAETYKSDEIWTVVMYI